MCSSLQAHWLTGRFQFSTLFSATTTPLPLNSCLEIQMLTWRLQTRRFLMTQKLQKPIAPLIFCMETWWAFKYPPSIVHMYKSMSFLYEFKPKLPPFCNLTWLCCKNLGRCFCEGEGKYLKGEQLQGRNLLEFKQQIHFSGHKDCHHALMTS